ncbi:hypothetical protein [Paenibacillus sp. FSL R7-0333]|uniref:hypothetical protein n=1 Tax=Paenibacillus sp. FSL R7-0333 TaxID=1926587 RepID=UPI00096CC79F|nr:hypothetical protein BK146_10195 [Paenibacillus sp. FSL R7-0333]
MSGNDKKHKEVIPEFHSPVRHMINEAYKLEHKFIENYEQAKLTGDAVVVMQGDWGGQIYLVCPMNLVRCDKQTLHLLLDDLDQIAWQCNEGEGKGIYYERKNVGDGIAGGMGGGIVSDTLWVHDEFDSIYKDIYSVIDGTAKRISVDKI